MTAPTTTLPLPLCVSDVESSLPTTLTLPERRTQRGQEKKP